jgi:hypothetical protein
MTKDICTPFINNVFGEIARSGTTGAFNMEFYVFSEFSICKIIF